MRFCHLHTTSEATYRCVSCGATWCIKCSQDGSGASHNQCLACHAEIALLKPEPSPDWFAANDYDSIPTSTQNDYDSFPGPTTTPEPEPYAEIELDSPRFQTEPGGLRSHPNDPLGEEQAASIPEDACANHADRAVTHRCVGCLTKYCEACVTNPKHPRIKSCPVCGDTAFPAVASQAPKPPQPEPVPPIPKPVLATDPTDDFTAEESYWREIPAAFKSAASFDAIKATLATSFGFLFPFFGVWSASYFATVVQSAAAGQTGLGRVVRVQDKPLHWLMLWVNFGLYFLVASLIVVAIRMWSLVDLFETAILVGTVFVVLITPMYALAIALNETSFVSPWEVVQAVFSNIVEYALWTATIGLGLVFMIGAAQLVDVSEGAGNLVLVVLAVFGIPHLVMVGAHLLGRVAYHSRSIAWPTDVVHNGRKPVNTILAVVSGTACAGVCAGLLYQIPSAADQIDNLTYEYVNEVTKCGTGWTPWTLSGQGTMQEKWVRWRIVTNPKAGIYRRADFSRREPDLECQQLFGKDLKDFEYEIEPTRDGDKASVLVKGSFYTTLGPEPIPLEFTVHLTRGTTTCPTGSECTLKGSCEPDGTVKFSEPLTNRCEYFAPRVWTADRITR